MIGLALSAPRLIDDLSNFVFDSFQRISPRAYNPATPVRIIDIDDASLKRMGQWPWPRVRLAELIEKLHDAGAAAIGLDIVLAEPDRTSPENLLPLLPSGIERDALAKAMIGLPGHDALFARTLTGKPVVLGALYTNTPGGSAPEAKFGMALAGDAPEQFLMNFDGVVPPLTLFQSEVAGIGALNWAPDRDLIVRRAPLLITHKGTMQPSLAAELLRVAQGAGTYVVRSSNASGQTAFGAATGLNAIKIGTLEIPTSARGDIRVRYTPSDPRRFISAADVFSGTIGKEQIAGQILLIGSSAAGLSDLRATPLDASVPGVEVHAQLLEHMLEGRALTRPDWAPALEWLGAILLSVILVFVANHFAPLVGAALGAAVVALLWGGSWLAFTRYDLLLDPLFTTLTSGLVYLAGVVTLFRSERLRRVAVRAAFSRFVSPDVVEAIAESPERLKLGGEMRDLTLMFSDMRDFTGISEGLDAETLTAFMNSYLAPMTDIILGKRGTLDKYMGDAIMAFWNAPLDDPLHARHACEAALDMLAALETLNAQWHKEAIAAGRDFAPIKIGIGINTGMGCVGNFGSELRFDYSVLGDDVNVASRIETLTKQYRKPIIASQSTQQAAPDFIWEALDDVQVKGRVETTRIYALLGRVD
jgi:adenylate cyclase